MSNLKPPALPVGDKPSWELRNADDDDETLKSIPESFVLFQSLKQSRERWLHQTFPKFASRPKGGKTPEGPPVPPHTFHIRGRCDIHIGPHIFPETTIYEVAYASPPGPTPGPPSAPPMATVTTSAPPTNNPYWSSTMAYNAQYQQQPPSKVTTPQSTNTAAVSPPMPAPVSAPGPTVASSSTQTAPAASPQPLTSAPPMITLDLIGKVNQAAENDPILSNLLKTAAEGQASAEQLKTLGLLIQSLDSIPFPNPAASHNATSASSAPKPANDYYQRQPPQVASVPMKPFDVVLEFRESTGDRWLFPRGSVYWETIPNPDDARINPDITLTTCLSNDGRISECLAATTGEGTEESRARYPVTIRIKEAPLTLSDTIYRWIGGTEINARNKQDIQNIPSFKRLYLGLQVPAGTLLTQLQASCNPAHALKPLRQGPAPPPRAPRPRKPPAEPKKVANKVVPVASVAPVVPEVPIAAEPPVAAPPTAESAPPPPAPPPAKRQRTVPPKAPPPPPIRCSSCGQTDVPLILGGRYCKPCVEAKRHIPSLVYISPHSAHFGSQTAHILPQSTSLAGPPPPANPAASP